MSFLELFDAVTQSGQETGNRELEDYLPQQVSRHNDDVLIVLESHGSRFRSGKLRSKKTLGELAPNGGTIDIEVSGPFCHLDGRADRFAQGLWPAIWLLGDGDWPTHGEIDLFESMHFSREKALQGFSTLHFGPSRGRDALWPGNWGMRIGHAYQWNPRNTLRFEWRREGSHWRASLDVNGCRIWSFTTTRYDAFAGFEHGKQFRNAGAHEFAVGAPGDPAGVFQRAFDTGRLRLIVNLAVGGTPFPQIDHSLQRAVLCLHRVAVTPF